MYYYNELLDEQKQIAMEEKIAGIIFENCLEISESDCADLGRELLKIILLEFRPDLFVDETQIS